jgi:hypothetical protein
LTAASPSFFFQAVFLSSTSLVSIPLSPLFIVCNNVFAEDGAVCAGMFFSLFLTSPLQFVFLIVFFPSTVSPCSSRRGVCVYFPRTKGTIDWGLFLRLTRCSILQSALRRAAVGSSFARSSIPARCVSFLSPS